MEFLIKTQMDKDAVNMYQRVATKTVQKIKQTVMRWGLMIFGWLSAYGGLSAIFHGHASTNAVFGLVVGVLAFLWGFYWYRYVARRNSRGISDGVEQQFYFNEDGLCTKAGDSQMTHRYSEIHSLAETQEYFVIFLQSKEGYIFRKTGFVTGTPADFSTFIQKKTGKQLPFVKI